MEEKRVKISEKTNTMSLERAKQLFSYSPENGEIRWIARPSGRQPKNLIGTIAGSINPVHGHRIIRVDYFQYYAQQIAWFLHYGVWPKGRIRFHDNDKLNYQIANMSDCFIGDFDHTDKDSRLAYMREYGKQANDNPVMRDKYYRAEFGITLEEYNALLESQNSTCAICHNPETETRSGRVKSLPVDHHHDTGKVRGLLCAACNKGIGWFKENPDVLRAAADYIEKHRDTGESRGVSPAPREQDTPGQCSPSLE